MEVKLFMFVAPDALGCELDGCLAPQHLNKAMREGDAMRMKPDKTHSTSRNTSLRKPVIDPWGFGVCAVVSFPSR